MASYDVVKDAVESMFFFKGQQAATETIDLWFQLLVSVPDELWKDFWLNLTVAGIPERHEVVAALRGLDLEADWLAIVETATAQFGHGERISKEAYGAVQAMGGIAYLSVISAYELSKCKRRFIKLATPTITRFRHSCEVERVEIFSPYSQIAMNKTAENSLPPEQIPARDTLSPENRNLLTDKIAGVLQKDMGRRVQGMNELFYKEGKE